MIIVNITDKEPVIVSGLIQWNYGQKLQITGLNLPETVEIHFSLTENCGNRVPSIGRTVDGITEVDIPDFILQNESEDACHSSISYYAYAFVYVVDGETGTTERKIILDIERSPKPTTNVPESKKDPFLEEVRQIMAETKEVAQSVRTDADNGKFNGPQGDPGKDGKSAYQYAVEGGYTKTEEEFKESLARAGDVITKEEHEAELLKAFVKVTTDKAPFHHITDSANMKVVDFGMEGLTEQPTTSGKNFYSGGNIRGTGNSWKKSISTIPAGTYMVSANVSSSDTDHTDRLILFYYEDNSSVGCQLYNGTREKRKVTFSKNVNGIICYASNNGTNSADDTFSFTDIQIEPGEVATEYEPYTNGPSPNPDYEQHITLAGVLNEETGRYEHKCCVGNKNFITHEDIMNPNGLAVGGQNGYDSVEYNEQTGEYTFLKPKKTYNSMSYIVRKKLPKGKYTISCVLVDTDGSDFSTSKIEISKTTPYSFITNNIYKAFGEMVCTFELTEETEIQINFMQSSYYSTYTILKNIQLERDSTYTPYEMGYNQSFTLTSDRPLTMWDNLVKVDGKWYWDYKQLKLIVDGNPNWSLYTAKLGFGVEKLPERMSDRDGLCNQLRLAKLSNYTGTNTIRIGYNNQYIQVIYSDFYDDTLEDKGLANWKAHLNEHPLEIVTYKDKSELVPLPDEEQTLLHNLETYYGVTNVYNEQGCPISITYCADQELHWNQKLLQIQQAII